MEKRRESELKSIKRFKFKMNLFFVLGISMIVLFPPEFLQVKHKVNVRLIGKPIIHKNSVRYGHYWIEFPNESMLKLKLMESKFECINLERIFNDLDSNSTIQVCYTKMFLFGLFGDNTVLNLKVKNKSYIDHECIKINFINLYIIITLLILTGLIISLKKVL